MTYDPNNPFRRKLIFLEGCDQTGKSTLMRALNYRGGLDCLVYDRGPINRIVCTQFFANHAEDDTFPVVRRAQVYLGFVPQLRDLMFHLVEEELVAVIYLQADPDILQVRMRENDHYVLTKRVLEVQHGLFLAEIARYGDALPLLLLDSGTISAERNLTAALDWLRMTQYHDFEPHYPASCLEKETQR